MAIGVEIEFCLVPLHNVNLYARSSKMIYCLASASILMTIYVFKNK